MEGQRVSWKEKVVHVGGSSRQRLESVEEPLNDAATKGPDKKYPKMTVGEANKSFSSSFGESFDSQERTFSTSRRGFSKARTYSTLVPFKKKSCTYFVEGKQQEGFCCCGRRQEWHSKICFKSLDEAWDAKKHVESRATNANGEVEFHGTNRKTRAKYIRVSNDTDAKDALKMLLREWKLEFPNFLVSVTGGAKSFKLPLKLKQLFSNGLFKVAQTTGAWVVTGGTNTGVMKHVGEALQVVSKGQYGTPWDSQKRVYCIGIATWGIVEHRNLLTNPKNGAVKYYLSNSIATRGAFLDNNHTHFFLVDDGTVNKYGKEIQFRAQLEKQIMKMEVDKNRGKVPAILLVLEGGPNTIMTVYEAITQDPVVPVVVIKDSGRAADLLAYAHNISHGEGPLYDMGDVTEHKLLLKKIEQTFPEMDSAACLKVYANILKCVEKKHLITIFKMEEGTADLDQAILTALLKSKSTSPEDQLKLALIWNRPDIARAQIFNEDLKWPLSSLEAAMKNALEKGRTEFVELLLEHGVNMANFLNKDRLEGLYSSRAWKRNSIMRYLLSADKRDAGSIRLCDVHSVFYMLTGLSLEQPHRAHIAEAVLPLDVCDTAAQSFDRPFNAFNALFIWAVLNNMQKMALCFWRHGEEALAKALIACRLYFAMAKYGQHRELKDDLTDSLKLSGEEFQRLAVQLLDNCFVTDEPRANKLLTYELENWGKTTNLNLAVSSGHTDFVAHSCNQELLTDIWSGVMTFRTQKSFKVVVCMLIPPLVLCLGFRTKKEWRKMPQTESSYEQFEDFEDEEENNEEDGDEDEKNQNAGGSTSSSYRLNRCSTFESSFDTSHLSGLAESQRDVETITSSEILKSHSLKWWEKYIGFYTAPITKFWGNVLSYIIFLALFTYVLLGKFHSTPSTSELIVIIFVISLTTEEVRQILKSDSGSLRTKIYKWSRSKWNLCDGLAIMLFYIGLVLRLNEATMTAGRVIFAIDIMFWIIRLLDIFSVNQNLGPYVVIIGKMTIDLAYFLFIMAVFLLAYGVARQTLLKKNSSFMWNSVAEIFFVPYFQVYGELFIEKEHLFSTNTTYFGTRKHSSFIEPVVSFLMAFYLLIANILLLNLLIAIFNNTFAKVQANSNVIWKFQRYHLILEYARRPALVPPFVIINHILSVCRSIFRKCRRLECCGGHEKASKDMSDRKIQIYPTQSELDDLMQFEDDCLADLLRKKDDILSSSKEKRMRVILERIDDISWRIDENKKETWKREDNMDTRLLILQRKIEELTSNVAEMTDSSRRRDNSYEPVPADNLSCNQVRTQGNSSSPWRRASEDTLGKSLASFGPPPRRFLSQNPYMQSEAYNSKRKVKEAAWTFRRSSLKNSGPSKEDLMKALSSQESFDGEDFVDAPPAKLQEDRFQSSETLEEIPERRRTLSCPSRSSFEGKSSDSNIQRPPHYSSFPEKDEAEEADHDTCERDVDEVVLESMPAMPLPKEARISPYPASGVARFPVPDCYVSWDVDYPLYKPTEYTSSMLQLSSWIDSEDSSGLAFNSVDLGVNRISNFIHYDVIDGKPRNPLGRTGITGRGLLGRWGPNHATEAIITRWKRKPNNEKFARGKFSLEFLALKKNEEITFIGGMIISLEKIPKFASEILKLEEGKLQNEKVDKMLLNSFEVSKEFDDARNTDNSWLETKFINFHDEHGIITKDLQLKRFSLVWLEVDSDVRMTPKRKEYLAKIATEKGAHF